VALLIALYISSLFLPVLNKTLGNSLELVLSENIVLIAGLFVLAVLTGIASGMYPVVMISSFRLGAVKTPAFENTAGNSFRNGLVVFQFMVSISLIISFMVVSKQLDYINSKELGLDKENIIIIPATPLLLEKLDVFKEQLSQNSNIIGVTASKRVPSEGLWDSNDARITSGDSSAPLGFRLANVRIDADFIPTYRIKLAAGRNFYKNKAGDFGYIINELAVKKIGWRSPEEAIGQVIEYGGWKGNVIGVVKDFQYESLHNPLSPIIMYCDPSDFNLISIRISGSDRSQTLSFIEKTWQAYNNVDYLFSHEYLTDKYSNLYKSEENTRTIFVYCMVIAISIAVLGLIGLSLFLIERRTKEIGIRKVNGANIIEIWAMLSKDFLRWVIIAFVIACPIAWFAMHRWLQNFAYKTNLSWWVFLAAGAAAVAVAVFTVSIQSYKAANKNPIESLRYE
jgi:putative ABC transport system permease protein